MKNEVQFYSNHAKELKHTQQHKIEKILTGIPDMELAERIPGLEIKMGCLAYSKETKLYYCLPLTDYNTYTYRLKKEGDLITCNCQGFTTKAKKWVTDPINAPKPSCSHQGMLYEYWARTHRTRKIYQALMVMF